MFETTNPHFSHNVLQFLGHNSDATAFFRLSALRLGSNSKPVRCSISFKLTVYAVFFPLQLIDGLSPKITPCLVLVLLPGQPLHVARVILPTLAQRDDVVHFTAVTPRRPRIGPLELGFRVRVPFDLAPVVRGRNSRT